MMAVGNRGRTSERLEGIDYAVYNTIAQFPRITTSDLVSRLSGYPGEDVRESIRHLRKYELICRHGRDSNCRVQWEVRV